MRHTHGEAVRVWLLILTCLIVSCVSAHAKEIEAETERRSTDMGLQEIKPRKSNEIANNELKESIANAALGILEKNADFENLEDTKVEFGYLFYFEGHGIEGLFKVITDKATIYFAVQGEDIFRLNFSEESFQRTAESFLDLHG